MASRTEDPGAQDKVRKAPWSPSLFPAGLVLIAGAAVFISLAPTHDSF